MVNIDKLNIGRIVFQAPNAGDWAWYGGNHVLLNSNMLKDAKKGQTVAIGPYKVKVLDYIPEQNSYLCKRVDRPS